MASFERKKLKDHMPRNKADVPPGCIPAIGAIFCLVGLAAILATMGVIPMGRDMPETPPWQVAVIGGAFVLVGLCVLPLALATAAREKRRREAKERHPHQAWFADHPWDPNGISDDTFAKARKFLGGGLFMALFLLPFNWWGFFSEKGPAPVKVIVGIFDLIALLVLFSAVHLLLRRLKYGASVLHFERFPFFLGATLDAQLTAPKGIGNFDTLRICLRCVEEVFEPSTSKSDTQTPVCYEVYGDERVFDKPGNIDRLAAQLPISFPLPEQAPPTRLSKKPPTYWELEVEAKMPGIDYQSTFLVPVYAPVA